jgi:hypothetical protein
VASVATAVTVLDARVARVAVIVLAARAPVVHGRPVVVPGRKVNAAVVTIAVGREGLVVMTCGVARAVSSGQRKMSRR